MKKLFVGLLLVVSCASGSSKPVAKHQASARCEPAALEITAENLKFSQDCLATTADQSASLTFDNKDSTEQHNFAIFTDEETKDNVFRSELFLGPAVKTLEIPALDKGTYHFHCDVHPDTMKGTFIAA